MLRNCAEPITSAFPVQASATWHLACLNCRVMMRIQEYFQLMVERKASDLHLSSSNRPMFRVAGNMVAVNDQVLSVEAVKALIGEILPERNRLEWEVGRAAG